MNPSLKEINDIYLQIQDSIHPPTGYFEGITEEKRLDFVQKMSEYAPLYETTADRFRAVLSSLSPVEVIEGYQQGCRLLQSGLAGHMYHHFNEAYIPLMVQAVKNDEHTAWLFLSSLVMHARHMREEIAPLAMRALNSKWPSTREAALTAIGELRLMEARPMVEEMAKGPDPEISELARNVLEFWRSS